MTRSLATLACAILLSLSSTASHASALPSQSAANSSAWLSETANGTDGYNQAFDNFVFGADATSTGVEWTGWVLPSYGNIDGFTISFYNDALNGLDHVPGTLISSTTIAGTANQVNSGTHAGFGVFDFSASVSFTAVGGTQYWISIVADPERSTSWRWANSNGGDGMFFEDDRNGNAGPVATDLAFSLTDNTVPEPSSLALMGSGALAIAATLRKKMQKP